MNNNKVLLSLIALTGLCLSIASLALRGSNDTIGIAMMWGIGFPMFGLSLVRIIRLVSEEKHPEKAQQRYIDENDERNMLIQYKAKAKAGQLQQYLVIALTYILIIADAPFWMVLSGTLVFLSFNVFTSLYQISYQKSM